jgi:sec-independent protein translocase protein TatA
MRIGMRELLIVLAIVIIIFGPTQIPKLTRMFGKSAKAFKEGMEEKEEQEEKKPSDEE